MPEIDTVVQGHTQAANISSSETCSPATCNTELPNVASINLRDFYPYYTADSFIEVPDEVAEAMAEFDRKEAAYRLRTCRHKAYYRDHLMNRFYSILNGFKRSIENLRIMKKCG